MFGVSQSSILEPPFFKIFLANLFLIHTNTDIANFADDNTPYLSAEKCRRYYISVQMVWKQSFER